MKRWLAAASLALLACADRSDVTFSLESETCGACHAEHYAMWRTSPLATGGSSPVFQALLPEVEDAWGPVARERCVSCHEPGHAPDGGVGCVSCHAAVGNEATADAHLVVDAGLPFAGPFRDALPATPHGSRPGGFLASSELCGTCHEVTGPGLFVEPTHTEFLASRFAARGEGCAACHMTDLPPAPVVAGGPIRPRRDHRFVGLDPPWAASPEEAAQAAERSRALLERALDLEITPRDGGWEVAVTNVGAGHDVPTGVAMLWAMWVELVAADATGSVVWRSGERESDSLLRLADQPLGTHGPVALPTEATDVVRHRLAAGERRAVFIEGVPRAVTLEAVLWARAVRVSLLEALGLQDLAPAVPLHEVGRVRAGP